MRTTRLQRGFTLIELMMVVAIIGILAAIAIPQYHIYVGRAQLTEAIQVGSKLEPAIADALQNNIAQASINGGTIGIPADIGSAAGRYVQSISVVAGAVIVTMKTTDVSPCVTGKTVTLTPLMPTGDEPIQWTCSSNSTCPPITCS